MVDTLTPQERSNRMSRVKSKNTGPELIVRRLLHGMGLRFRLHKRSLPGTPDIVLPKFRKAVFVHGCYWHGHGCRSGQPSKSNTTFWSEKISRNRERDARNIHDLSSAGWSTIIIWSCQTKNLENLRQALSISILKI